MATAFSVPTESNLNKPSPPRCGTKKTPAKWLAGRPVDKSTTPTHRCFRVDELYGTDHHTDRSTTTRPNATYLNEWRQQADDQHKQKKSNFYYLEQPTQTFLRPLPPPLGQLLREASAVSFAGAVRGGIRSGVSSQTNCRPLPPHESPLPYTHHHRILLSTFSSSSVLFSDQAYL